MGQLRRRLLAAALVAGLVCLGQTRWLTGAVSEAWWAPELADGERRPAEESARNMDFLNCDIKSKFESFKTDLERLFTSYSLSVGKSDPDIGRNGSQIIRSRGFEVEEHDVTTKDGYILTVFRIINPLMEPAQRRHMKPVILQHGLLSSCVDWIINSPGARPAAWPPARPLAEPESLADELADSAEYPNALGYYLANRGYDVWLANSRGNVYGQRHVRLKPLDQAFWQFTFDDQIDYDLPALVAHIIRRTRHSRLAYVGHSQGTTMAFGLLASRPEFAQVLEPVIALAPVAFVSNVKTDYRFLSVITDYIQDWDGPFGVNTRFIEYVNSHYGWRRAIIDKLLEFVVAMFVGPRSGEMDSGRIEAYSDHYPSGTSIRNIVHWGQLVNSGRFCRFRRQQPKRFQAVAHLSLANKNQEHLPPFEDIRRQLEEEEQQKEEEEEEEKQQQQQRQKRGSRRRRARQQTEKRADRPLEQVSSKPETQEQGERKDTVCREFELARARSSSIVLFAADQDFLAAPADVAKLRAALPIKPMAFFNMTEFNPKWNHLDFVYSQRAGRLVNVRIERMLRQVEARTASAARS